MLRNIELADKITYKMLLLQRRWERLLKHKTRVLKLALQRKN